MGFEVPLSEPEKELFRMSNTEAQGHDDKSLIKNLKDENI